MEREPGGEYTLAAMMRVGFGHARGPRCERGPLVDLVWSEDEGE